MMSPQFKLTRLALVLLLGVLPFKGLAQWLTQTNNLVPGWNAVYLSVDASYNTIDNLVGGDSANPIQEIWLWAPAPGSGQFLTDPASPYSAGSQWVQWQRSAVNISANPLNKLRANQAFLVRTTNAYAWKVKGTPSLPSYNWNSSGENFIGFPANPATPPSFDQYLSKAPLFESTAQIFRYPGGNLGATNPILVGSFAATQLTRGQAYWVRSANFNNYYAPFTVSGLSAGLSYGASGGQSKITLANNTAQALTVYANLLNSEVAPTNQAPVVATPPLLLRGAINTQNLTYGYSTLNGAVNVPITLQPAGTPGSTIDVVVGLNRSAISGANPGDLIAGVLRLTDATGLSQIDVPVNATVSAANGLWVGKATVSSVNQYLNNYYTANSLLELTNTLTSLNLTNGANGVTYQIDDSSKRIIAFSSSNGVFLSTSTTITNAGVSKPFDVRLIMHSGTNTALGTARATLLQHAYIGKDLNGNMIVATTTNLLDSTQLGSARRVSAIQFPWQGDANNAGWTAAEPPSATPSVYTFTVPIDYNDQASNPFVHNYHPDHDNLDANFSPLPNGQESFTIQRTIRLFFTAPGNDFVSLTGSSGHLQGNYTETITLTDGLTKIRNFDVAGTFVLNQIVQSDNLGYITSGPQAQSLQFSQAISFPAQSDRPYTPLPYTLSALTSSGLPAVFTINSGNATVSSNLLTTTGLGLVTVTASQPGGGYIAPALSVQRSFTVTPGLNAITFNSISSTNFTTGAIPLMATASSGLPVTISLLSGPGSLSGNNLTLSSVGTIVLVARQAGNALYQAAVPVTNSISVTPAGATITFAQLPDIAYTTTTIPLSATASSGLPVSFSILSGPATVSGNNNATMSITGVGQVAVVARQNGNVNYSAATAVTNRFTVRKADETITFAQLPDIAYTTTPITLSGSSSSGLGVTFAVTAGLATISGNSMTITGVGNVTVTASQSGNGNYNAATAVARTFAVGKASQSINFAGIANGTYLGAPVNLQGTSSSGLPVTFSVASGPATISGNILTYTGAGNVTVNANQAGNANYQAAPQVSQAFSVAQAAQTISFTAIPNGTYLGAPVTLQASASSALPVTFSVASGPATISGNTLTYTGAGNVTVNANQAGNGNYLAAPQVSQSFSVAQAAQTITFASIPNGTYLGPAITLAPTSSSGLPVSLSVSGPATLSGNTLTYTGAGSVSVVATQTGNGNYLAATSVTRTFTVAQAAQTITFNQPADTTYSTSPIALTASASSGLGISFAVTGGPATVSGNSLTLTGVGTVTVSATQAGNGNYLAASPVSRSFAVSKASQAINFAAIPDTAYGSGAINLSATAVASGAVTFSVVTGPAQVTGSQLTLTGVGSVTVAANQAGDGNYLAAPQVTRTFNATKGNQSISFTAPANSTWPVSGTIALNATSTSGGAITYSIGSGPATISGSTLTVTGAGTISINANQSGTANYNAAPQATVSFVVNQGTQSITFTKPADTTYPVGSPISLSASATSGGAVSFSVASGPASVSGSSLTVTGAGVITVTATQAGTANYLSAQTSQSFTVNKANQSISFTAPSTTYPSGVNLSATASSGLAVTFSVVSGPGTISGTTLTPTGAGTVVVAANQAGNGNYLAASQVNGNVTVNKGSQTITFVEVNGHYNRTDRGIFTIPRYAYSYSTALATASSGLPVSYTIQAAANGNNSISGNILTTTFTSNSSTTGGLITYQLLAQQPGDSNYNAAPSVTTLWYVSYP